MDKTIWKIDKLHNWKDNPRAIKKSDFERLKRQIKELGQYKPLLVTPDGEVLGGNMRLRAYQELKIEDVWVSVVTPKSEEDKIKYALSDNDRAGYYLDDQIANLIGNYADFPWEDYAVDLNEPLTLDNLQKIGEILEDIDRLDVITVEPPEAPMLKERVSVHFTNIEDYNVVKNYLAENPAEKLLDLIKNG